MTPFDVMRELEKRAKELGWDIETNWRDGDDETSSWDVYLSKPEPADG